MTIFTDGLNGTAGETLATRSGWLRSSGADEAILIAAGSGFSLAGGTTTASGTWHAPTNQPASPNQYAEAILPSTSQNGFPLGVRCDTSSALGVGYLVRYFGVLQLYRRGPTGGLALLGSYTVPTPSDLTTNPVRLEIIGTALNVYFKGAAVISVTNSIIATGSVAMLSRGGSVGTVADVDNWQSGEAGAVAITGTGSATFAGLTSSAVAAIAIRGAASRTFAALTGSAAARLKIAASANSTFAPMTGTGAGGLAIGGDGAASFAPMTGSAAARLAIAATANIAFAPMTGTAGGLVQPTLPNGGQGSTTFAPMTGRARGRVGQLTPVQFLTLTADPIALQLAADALDLQLTVAPIDLIIVVTQNGDRIVKTLPNKSPEAVFRVTLNMPAWITPDNPVVNLEMVPIRGDVVLYDPEVLAPDRAEFWISGGTRGVTAVFGALAHLQDGQRYPQTIRIRVAD